MDPTRPVRAVVQSLPCPRVRFGVRVPVPWVFWLLTAAVNRNDLALADPSLADRAGRHRLRLDPLDNAQTGCKGIGSAPRATLGWWWWGPTRMYLMNARPAGASPRPAVAHAMQQPSVFVFGLRSKRRDVPVQVSTERHHRCGRRLKANVALERRRLRSRRRRRWPARTPAFVPAAGPRARSSCRASATACARRAASNVLRLHFNQATPRAKMTRCKTLSSTKSALTVSWSDVSSLLSSPRTSLRSSAVSASCLPFSSLSKTFLLTLLL